MVDIVMTVYMGNLIYIVGVEKQNMLGRLYIV